MKILALDIGAGTEDVLLYDDKKENIENCIKMVLPSPSLIYAKKVRKATVQRKNLLIKGSVIGGGAFSYSLKKHIRSGLKVFITTTAAYTIRNDPDQVRESGFEIIDSEEIPNFDGEVLILEEINIEQLKKFLKGFGEDLLDVDFVAIAVQDHGISPKGMSDRQYRMEKIAENRTIIQYLPYVTRWDYLATMFTEAITINAPEQLGNIQVPKRASYIRVIILELSRIASHL